MRFYRRTIDLPHGLAKRIEDESHRRNVTKARIIRWALNLGLRQLEQQDKEKASA